MLKITDLYKKYDNVLALDGLNMDIQKGELYGFVGPNGAGKTTTIRIIAGLYILPGERCGLTDSERRRMKRS